MRRSDSRAPTSTANLLPGGGAAFPREQSLSLETGITERVYRGGWSIGAESFERNTTFQAHVDANGSGIRFVRRSTGDYTKRWNWVCPLLTSQIADIIGGPVVFGFSASRNASLIEPLTFEILESKELLNPIYAADGYYSSGNEIIATTTFLPPLTPAPFSPLMASLSTEAMCCAVRISGTWEGSSAGAEAFVTNLFFGRRPAPPFFSPTSRLNQFPEALSYNQSTYARGVPPGQPDTLSGSLTGSVIALDGAFLGVFFNYRFNTVMTPRVKVYSPKSGNVGGCYNETQAADDIPITLMGVTDTGVTAYFRRQSSGPFPIAVGDIIRLHIDVQV